MVGTLSCVALAANSEIAVTIAAAGAIPPLVQLLESDSPSYVQEIAACALMAAIANVLLEMEELGIIN
ncbi:hypothetical protein FOA52_014871 [Chlamydomonas sp. UWO 241]|nr:hypothetical protein FOA52_014871 [Chlamydomonas sp. UWO 241]